MRYTIQQVENGWILMIGEQHDINPKVMIFDHKNPMLRWLDSVL